MRAAFLFALTVLGVVLGVYAAESPQITCEAAVTAFSISCIVIGTGLLNYGLCKIVEEGKHDTADSAKH